MVFFVDKDRVCDKRTGCTSTRHLASQEVPASSRGAQGAVSSEHGGVDLQTAARTSPTARTGAMQPFTRHHTAQLEGREGHDFQHPPTAAAVETGVVVPIPAAADGEVYDMGG